MGLVNTKDGKNRLVGYFSICWLNFVAILKYEARFLEYKSLGDFFPSMQVELALGIVTHILAVKPLSLSASVSPPLSEEVYSGVRLDVVRDKHFLFFGCNNIFFKKSAHSFR